LIARTLMIAFVMAMLNVFVNGVPKMCFVDRDDSIQTFILD